MIVSLLFIVIGLDFNVIISVYGRRQKCYRIDNERCIRFVIIAFPLKRRKVIFISNSMMVTNESS